MNRYNFDADPDPDLKKKINFNKKPKHLASDMDLGSQNEAGPCGSGSTTLQNTYSILDLYGKNNLTFILTPPLHHPISHTEYAVRGTMLQCNTSY